MIIALLSVQVLGKAGDVGSGEFHVFGNLSGIISGLQMIKLYCRR
jgi:hypothetical protein